MPDAAELNEAYRTFPSLPFSMGNAKIGIVPNKVLGTLDTKLLFEQMIREKS